MKDLAKRNDPSEQKKSDLFDFKVSKEVQHKQVRKELERAYDQEKSKVSLQI